MQISFVGHSHHRVTQSSRFFVDLLVELGDVQFFWDETWHGLPPPDAREITAHADLVDSGERSAAEAVAIVAKAIAAKLPLPKRA